MKSEGNAYIIFGGGNSNFEFNGFQYKKSFDNGKDDCSVGWVEGVYDANQISVLEQADISLRQM